MNSLMKNSFSPSAMVAVPGLLVALLGRLFFRKVTFDEVALRKIREAETKGHIVYVMNSKSFLDYVYFQWALGRNGLPLVGFSPDMGWYYACFVRPLYQLFGVVFRSLFGSIHLIRKKEEGFGWACHSGMASLIFLRRGSFPQFGSSDEDQAQMEALIGLQAETELPILFVPQFILWKRTSDRYQKSIIDMAFGHPDAPGRIRKFVNFVLNHRRASVHVGDSLNLEELLESKESQGLDSATLVKNIRWRLHHQFSIEYRVLKGPIVKNAARIRSEIMRNGEFAKAVEETAIAHKKDPSAALKQADKYLKEMAADFSMGAVELLCMVLALIWNRLYTGIEVEEEGLERLRKAAKRAPLVIVPTHRSHVDYLVMSYVFYNRGLIPPHIAAGINLSFFPLGYIFRRCGAFFIRRTFKDNPVYAMTFRHYLRKLLKEGHWVEFFPEGGRSRTGKVLPPKLGMMRELLDAVEDGVREDVYFCPVSISYEKVVEENAYRKELSGGVKQSESVGGVLKATKVLVTKHGRLSLRFAEPISTREFLNKLEPQKLETEGGRSRTLQAFGYTIMKGMNDAAIVTPSALMAMVMLAHPRTGISRSQLVLRTAYLMAYLEQRGAFKSGTLRTVIESVSPQLEHVTESERVEYSTSESLSTGADLTRARVLSNALENVVDETLGLFQRDNAVEVTDYGDEVAYTVRPESRISLDFYKNNILHLVAEEGILSTALLTMRGEEASYDRLRGVSLFLSKLFKLELVYQPGESFDIRFFRTLGRFVDEGWIVERSDGGFEVEPDSDELVRFFANCLQPYVEGYWLALTHLESLRDGPRPEKVWIRTLHERADRLSKEGVVRCPEASSSVTFKHALDIYHGMGLVERYKEEDLEKGGKKARPERMIRVELEHLKKIALLLPDLEHARAIR